MQRDYWAITTERAGVRVFGMATSAPLDHIDQCDELDATGTSFMVLEDLQVDSGRVHEISTIVQMLYLRPRPSDKPAVHHHHLEPVMYDSDF